MPAIPTHARLEVHVSDEELVALTMFLEHAILLHIGGHPSPLVRAAGGNQIEASKMLCACREINQAAKCTLLERKA